MADVTLNITVPEAKVAVALEFLQNFGDLPVYWKKAEEALPDGTQKQLAEKCLALKLAHDLGRYLNMKAQAAIQADSSDGVFT